VFTFPANSVTKLASSVYVENTAKSSATVFTIESASGLEPPMIDCMASILSFSSLEC
jgi:hypothetical protein